MQMVADLAHIHQCGWERAVAGSAAGLQAACFGMSVQGPVAGQRDSVGSRNSAAAEACFVVDIVQAAAGSRMGCRKQKATLAA